MSPRPTDSFFPRILIRPRVAEVSRLGIKEVDLRDEFTSTTQQMVRETEEAMKAIQESVVVSVRDYHRLCGKGRNLVDDLAITQRTVNALGNNGGGFLFLPKGDYFFNGSLTHSFDNVVIFGEGENTVIHQSGLNTLTFNIGNTTVNTTGVGVRDLLIDDEGTGITISVSLLRCIRSHVDRVTVIGTPTIGILISGGDTINVTNNVSTTATIDLRVASGGGVHPDNVLVMHNHFDTYNIIPTVANNILIRDNAVVAIPTITVNGAASTITANSILSAPHRFIRIIGTPGGAAETVDTLGVTYEGDLRTFIFDVTDIVTFNDIATGANMTLSGSIPFVPTAGNEDTLTLMCDGTNWIEVARSTPN